MIKVAKNSDIALFILFLGGLNIALYRCTGIDTFMVGTLAPAERETAGHLLFCNDSLQGHKAAKELIKNTRHEVLETFNYASPLLNDLLEELRPEAIFNVACIYEPFQKNNFSLDRFDLLVVLSGPGPQMSLKLVYKTDLYSRPGQAFSIFTAAC
jgi:non-ribosomal peptide synthetase component F